MKKISKKAKMLNTLICNVIIAKSDYEDKRITLETFKAVYNLSNSLDRKSTRLNSSHIPLSRMPSSA